MSHIDGDRADEELTNQANVMDIGYRRSVNISTVTEIPRKMKWIVFVTDISMKLKVTLIDTLQRIPVCGC